VHALTPKCPNCGSEDFALVEDRSEYFYVRFDDGVPTVTGHRGTQSGERRVFCVDCHTYFEVPETLDTSEV